MICDPPPLVRKRPDLDAAARAYKDLNRLALARVEPGGFLLTFSCSGAVDTKLFRQIFFAAAVEAGVRVDLLEPLAAAPDHPVAITHPQGEYLKGWLARVRGACDLGRNPSKIGFEARMPPPAPGFRDFCFAGDFFSFPVPVFPIRTAAFVPASASRFARRYAPAMSRRLSLALWAGVLILALGLRLPPLRADLPYLSYVDEGWVLHPVIHLIGARTWDPGFYTYPSLPLYAIAGAAALYSPVYAAVHGRPLAADLAPDPWRHYDLVAPVELVVAGRLLCLAVSLGIVVLTGLLARRLAGEGAGLFAALLAALVPALVIRSAIVTVDPWAAFFSLAAIYFAEGAARGGRPWRDALLSGAMIGCGLTSKYPAVLVALAVVPALLRVAGAGAGSFRRWRWRPQPACWPPRSPCRPWSSVAGRW